jgi:Flp pilus assembly protein TadG
MSRFGWIALFVIALCMAGCNSKSDASSSKTTVAAVTTTTLPEVRMTGCKTSSNQFEGPIATVTVVNNTSKASNYIIDVTFDSTDGKTQLDSSVATVNNVAPGQTATADATSLKPDIKSPYVCKVGRVTRFAA